MGGGVVVLGLYDNSTNSDYGCSVWHKLKMLQLVTVETPSEQEQLGCLTQGEGRLRKALLGSENSPRDTGPCSTCWWSSQRCQLNVQICQSLMPGMGFPDTGVTSAENLEYQYSWQKPPPTTALPPVGGNVAL